MYDYTISILEFLLTYLSWAYFLLICLQCAQFSHCASSFQNNNNNNNTALESSLDFFIPSYLSWFKKIRWFIPRILMPVQVIWRFELTVHHEESSRSDWKLYHLPTFLLKSDEGFRTPLKNQAWARLWHSHYNHEGGVNTGQIEGGTCHQQWSWKI